MNLKALARAVLFGLAVTAATLPAASRNLVSLSLRRLIASRPPPSSQEVACPAASAVPCGCSDGSLCRAAGNLALFTGANAAECFSRASANDRFDAVSPFRLGQIHEACGRLAQAVDAYRKAPEIARAKVKSSETARLRGECALASRDGRMAMEIAPDSPDVRYQLGMVYAYCDPRDYPAAVRAFNDATALGYRDPYVWTRVAHAHAMAGQYREALDILQAHDQDNGLAVAIKGEALMAVGRFREAAETLAAATAREPMNPWFSTSLGHAYWAAGEPVRARESWRRALTIQRDFGPALDALARHPE